MSQRTLSEIPVSELKGVGPKSLKKLAKLGVSTLHDLLLHLPHRYEDRSKISPIIDARSDEYTTILGTIKSTKITYGRKKIFSFVVQDSSSIINISFFSYSQAILNQFTTGGFVRCYGMVKRDNFGTKMVHPDCKIVTSLDPRESADKSYTPIYPLTEGVTNMSVRGYVKTALMMSSNMQDGELLPASDARYQFLKTLRYLHSPRADGQVEQLNNFKHPYQLALIKDELLSYNVSLLKLRRASAVHHAKSIEVDGSLREAFVKTLDFTPTGAQSRVTGEIDKDLKKDHPMMRLVQGDVGSGKTLVAAFAALSVIQAGQQVGLLAPTEILAEQHASGFEEWFGSLGVRVGWLAGRMSKKTKTAVLEKLAAGEIDLLVGTHAIFQEDVTFSNLGLIVVDEQHRFGVHQRLALREKGAKDGIYPHQLVMTATPIPRTLAMVAYADLDTSIIDELPPGRTPIKTVAMSNMRRNEIIQRIKTVCKEEGRQVYWVCTLIEESDVMEQQAATEAFEGLQLSLPDLTVGLVHGRMKSADKQAVMEGFKSGEIDLLVATTVIEVGVNVPNASLMIIENPERLGLAQLHQLRGRVGRGTVASHCVLLYKSPLTAIATERLGVLRESNDGFVIAQKDLDLRGPGELLGTKQTGLANLKVADLARDAYLIPVLQDVANQYWQTHPEKAELLLKRWQVDHEEYGSV
jgi:ATP-dependent DNA helicase RecG